MAVGRLGARGTRSPPKSTLVAPSPERRLPPEAKTPDQEEIGLITAGQRRINIIWEVTQAIIAVLVTGATLYVACTMSITPGEARPGAFLLLSNAFFLVIATYISRTNHQKTGGVAKGDQGR